MIERNVSVITVIFYMPLGSLGQLQWNKIGALLDSEELFPREYQSDTWQLEHWPAELVCKPSVSSSNDL